MIQDNHHAALVHTLWQSKKREKERKFNENTASSSKQYYFLEYLVFFLKNKPTKKQKIGGKTGEATTVVPGIRITSRTLWTATNKLEAGPAAKGRDIISSSTWYFFLKNQPTKKNKNRGKNWRSYYRCTWYTYHIKDALDNHEQTGGGAGCKRPRLRRSHVCFFRLVATCDVPVICPTQKLPLFFNLI